MIVQTPQKSRIQCVKYKYIDLERAVEDLKAKNGYFTAEAALIFPMVLGTVLFVAYMLLFQYDRCLMEQDMGALALWGCRAEGENTGELQKLIQKRVSGIYWDKYAVWRMNALEVRLEKNTFSVAGSGSLTFPLPGFNFWSRDNIWEAEAEYHFWRISPTDFVRLCNKADILWNERKAP